MLALTGVQSVAANRRRTMRPWAAEAGEAGTDGTDAVTIPVDNFGADNADGTGGSEHARGGDDGVGAPDESTVTGARARNDRRG